VHHHRATWRVTVTRATGDAGGPAGVYVFGTGVGQFLVLHGADTDNRPVQL